MDVKPWSHWRTTKKSRSVNAVHYRRVLQTLLWYQGHAPRKGCTLQLLAQQSDEVKAVVSEVIIRGAYSAHSEKLLTSILCSDKQEDRKFAVNKILEIRGGKEEADMSVHIRRNPAINMAARTPVELIDCSSETVLEPVFRLYL